MIEIRLNEESNRMNTNQRRYVDSRIIPHLRRNVYPERRFVDISRKRVPEKAVLGTYRTAGEELHPGRHS